MGPTAAAAAAIRPAILDNAWARRGRNDHNGRHELHDVNAPPTARRPGLNLILIKSNKSAGESSRPRGAAVLFREGSERPRVSRRPSSLSLFLSRCERPARMCRIKSDGIFF